MSIQQVSALTQNNKRRFADFDPSVWGDYFLSHSSTETVPIDAMREQVEELKEEVKELLLDSQKQPLQKLELIESIQRLGVAYHFEREIGGILENMHHSYSDGFFDGEHGHEHDDLYEVALCFRLLRQHRYYISCDVFNKFKDEEGTFRASLTSDVRAMLSLYEAAHLRLHGEEVLDEAISFTITHLRHSLMEIGHTSPHLSEKVMWALNRPVHKTIPMLESRHYISIYPKEDSHNKTLLKLAELDFNLLQALHQKELNSIARWWKNLDFARKFPYARDRVIELYFWILAMYFEPEYIHVREFVTKSVTMISIIDDTYDVHGTYEEIKLFTQAIKRWDISAKDSLPDYMQLIYEAILDVYDEIEEHNAKEGRSYRAHYAKETMKEAVQAYFDEASWFYDEYIPTLEDYMSIMDVSCAYPFIIKTSFLGVGEIATKEVFDWAFDKPKIIKATSAIGRIMNDIVSHKFEQKRGHAASSVECYMKQHGVQEEEAYKMLRQKIEDAWKDINQELLKSTFVPTVLLGPILNLNRVSEFIYRDDDCYTKAHKIKDDLALLLVHPVSTLHQDVQP